MPGPTMRIDRPFLLLWALVPQLALAQGAKLPAETEAPKAAPAAPGAADPRADAEAKALEERVTDLKDKIFRTKARLLNLQEIVIGGELAAGARATLVHRNEMGSSFALESVSYALDGAPVYSKADLGGDLRGRQEFEVFSGKVTPGSHQLAVQIVYRGRGFGPFRYLDGYRFKVQSTYSFEAQPGKVATVRVVGFERGGLTARLEDRPAVRYDLDLQMEPAPPSPGGRR
ncbi:MAG TPA: dihydrolipoamide acetyltransferase [Anaeromyxobacteraceae bacterium]|nr:dihydrolipoamide acetyltransferase [Anaeromyxobacteraceae bacterium]